VAGGATHAYFGNDHWAGFAPGMKTLEDARKLRSHILSAFELAETIPDPSRRKALLTFVVVGAGPTGVELVGQVAELAKKVLPREYRWVDTAKEIRVILVEAGPAVLGPFHPKLQRYARKHLVKLGVEVRTDTMATDMDADSITVKSAAGLEKINARIKIWAAGVQASPLAVQVLRQGQHGHHRVPGDRGRRVRHPVWHESRRRGPGDTTTAVFGEPRRARGS
jgi:NADH:ubiquinone reductase (H+-translocating)